MVYKYRLQRIRKMNSAGVEEWAFVPESDAFIFQAGQYVSLHYAQDSPPLYYTIAAACQPGEPLLFYVNTSSPDPDVARLQRYLLENESVWISAPQGSALYTYDSSLTPIIAVSRTGIAQAKAWLEAAHHARDPRLWTLIWQIRSPDDYFFSGLNDDWLNLSEQFIVTLVPPSTDDWTGRVGDACTVLSEMSLDWRSIQLYTSGSWGFTDLLLDTFASDGLKTGRCISDRLAFLP